MPLTLEELEDIQADCLADDVEIVFEKMSLWDETTVREYFENGGQLPGVDTQPPGAAGPMLPPVSEAELKRWFPKWKKVIAAIIAKYTDKKNILLIILGPRFRKISISRKYLKISIFFF